MAAEEWPGRSGLRAAEGTPLRIVIEQVVAADRQPETIEWVPAAGPFFGWQRECPQGDSNP